MTEERIKELEAKGFKRWTKGGFDRLYISPKHFVQVEYYRTGNIREAYINEDRISNCEAKRLMEAKVYIDLINGDLVCNNAKLKDLVEELIAR